MRAIRLCRRANATRRCTTRRVTSATAPTANDADGAVTVRLMIAPMATATAKSNAPSWASVRRSPSRRPMTATANIRTALTATQPRPPVSPTSSSNRFTPCAYRQPSPGACRARFAFRLHGPLAVGILKTAISAQERRCAHTEAPSSAGLAGRLTRHREALSPTTARAEEQDNGQPSASAQRVPAMPRRKCSTRSDGVQHTRGSDPWSARDRTGRRRDRRTVLSRRKARVATGLTPDTVGRWTLGGANHDQSAVAGLEGPG
jgi:hypothetical protein